MREVRYERECIIVYGCWDAGESYMLRLDWVVFHLKIMQLLAGSKECKISVR